MHSCKLQHCHFCSACAKPKGTEGKHVHSARKHFVCGVCAKPAWLQAITVAVILISGHRSEVSLYLPWGIKSHQVSAPRVLEMQQLSQLLD